MHLDRDVNQAGLRLNPQRHLTPVWGSATPVRARSPATWPTWWGGGRAGAVVGRDGPRPGPRPPSPVATASWSARLRLDNQLSCCGRGGGAVVRQREAGAGRREHARWWPCSITRRSAACRPRVPTAICWAACRTAGGVWLQRSGTWTTLAACVGRVPGSVVQRRPRHPPRLSGPPRTPGHFVRVEGGAPGPVHQHTATCDVRTEDDADTAASFDASARRSRCRCHACRLPRRRAVRLDHRAPSPRARLGIRTVDVGVAQLAMHSDHGAVRLNRPGVAGAGAHPAAITTRRVTARRSRKAQAARPEPWPVRPRRRTRSPGGSGRSDRNRAIVAQGRVLSRNRRM